MSDCCVLDTTYMSYRFNSHNHSTRRILLLFPNITGKEAEALREKKMGDLFRLMQLVSSKFRILAPLV